MKIKLLFTSPIGKFVYMEIKCRKCDSSDKVKAGFVRGRQRYKCRSCESRYLPQQAEIKREFKWDAVDLYLEGVCIRSIGRLLKVSHVTVIDWLKKKSQELKPLLPANANHIEMDEMYLYIKKNSITQAVLPCHTSLKPVSSKGVKILCQDSGYMFLPDNM